MKLITGCAKLAADFDLIRLGTCEVYNIKYFVQKKVRNEYFIQLEISNWRALHHAS